MKLRYYFRGLGIGILVTALIMGMTSKAGRPLTDAEIRAKALTLGMVDSNSISLGSLGGGSSSGTGSNDVSNTDPGKGGEDNGHDQDTPETTEPSETPDSQGMQEPEETAGSEISSSPSVSTAPESSPTPAVSSTLEPTPTLTPTPTPEPTPTLTPTPTSEPAATVETVTILIVRGDSSYTVSRRLEEAGLIENARDYDTYLVDNGYSKTIRTGTYKIPVNATWEEIAKIIA